MMEQISQHMSFEDIRNNPALVADLLLKDHNISLILERRGDKVIYTYMKAYDEENLRILREAKEEHKKRRKSGYTREQAFLEFEEARKEIGKYL